MRIGKSLFYAQAFVQFQLSSKLKVLTQKTKVQDKCGGLSWSYLQPSINMQHSRDKFIDACVLNVKHHVHV